MVMKCIIVEDEPIARNILKQYISLDNRLQLAGNFKSGVEGIQYIQSEPVDLVFLDIKMPQISGIELLKSLIAPPMVIFTTAYREYATDGFDLNAVDYLVKPFSFNRFLQAINKAVEFKKHSQKNKAEEMPPGSLFIKDGTKLIQVDLGDILFIEAVREYIKIVTPVKKYLIHKSMKSVEANLPHANFIRIHKSYIVAINKIDSIEGNTIIIGDHILPVSRQLKDEILEKITKNRTI